jgi:hypothetical protein
MKYKTLFSPKATPQSNSRSEPALKCEDCGETGRHVKQVSCPYASDVHNTEVPATLCPGCYGQRKDDI